MIITDRADLEKHLKELRKKGKKIVFTNGCFDLLHKGHVTYLEQAKKLGDILVVGLNSDDSIRALKGKQRPIMPLESRLAVLDSLKSVDIVAPFSEELPLSLIEIVKPDVHVKGGDYREENLPESKLVKSFGGRVVIIPFVPGFSVTSIVEKIRKSQ